MSTRPYVVSIAGMDPSAGAGLLADVKTMEQHRVYGLGVSTAITVQTDQTFSLVEWVAEPLILQQLEILLKRFPVQACKIGILPRFELLPVLVDMIKRYSENAFIVLDPVLSASTGFDFHGGRSDINAWLQGIDLVTPNYMEWEQLGLDQNKPPLGTAVLLKGGHTPGQTGTDRLCLGDTITDIPAFGTGIYPKHGSGCILSAAIASNKAKGMDLLSACREAKRYTETVLNSNSSLLAWHSI